MKTKTKARAAGRTAKTTASPKGKASTKTSARAPKKRDSRAESALLDRLVQAATDVREHAHAPYSRYKVGAAIVTRSGRVFTGCNVENASFGATVCAERGAIQQMVAAGERDPVACAVVTGDEEGAAPCGICRQVLNEFARDMPIVLVGLGSPDGATGRVVQLADLLPLAFHYPG